MNAPVVQTVGSLNNLKGVLSRNKNKFSQLLPKGYTVERTLQVMMQAARETPQVEECTIDTVMDCLTKSASLGLEPNTPLGHCYMIPFKSKGISEAKLIIGYKGLIELARRSGQIETIYAVAVKEADDFNYQLGTDPKIDHKPAMNDRGEILAFYGVAKLVGGGYVMEVMSREEVETVRINSPSASYYDKSARKRVLKKSGPWIEHFEEMGRKTVIRRLAKYLPMSIELAQAVTIADQNDTGQDFDTVEGQIVEEPDLNQDIKEHSVKDHPTGGDLSVSERLNALESGDEARLEMPDGSIVEGVIHESRFDEWISIGNPATKVSYSDVVRIL